MGLRHIGFGRLFDGALHFLSSSAAAASCIAGKRQNAQGKAAASLRRKVRVCSCRMFATPVVFGLIRPRIVLPRGFDWEDTAAQHILLHERVHISRWDNLVKIAAIAAVCVHWFNPLVWICFRLCSDDMEASCDERVLKVLGEESRKDYARSLLSMAEAQHRRMGVMPFLAFGESNLKQRVGNILKYHKKTLLSGYGGAAGSFAGRLLSADQSFGPGGSVRQRRRTGPDPK